MKTIIAGSRHFNDYQKTVDIIRQSGFQITQVVSGGARGVDTLGEQWAGEDNYIRFPANWTKHGKAAGPIRNQQMADYADALIAIYDSRTSRGTKDMIRRAKKAELKIYAYDLAVGSATEEYHQIGFSI
jgi:hypothetical protein